MYPYPITTYIGRTSSGSAQAGDYTIGREISRTEGDAGCD